MKNLKLFLLLTCGVFLWTNSLAQNYSQYYELIDSAEYYVNREDRVLANDYYLEALTKNRGFGFDYERAILNNYFVTQKLDFELIKKGFKDGLQKRDLVYELEKYGISYSKKEMRIIHRKNKLKKKKGSLPVYFALIKDQRSRSKKNGNMAKADSITGEKLKKWTLEKPHLFNRFETSIYGSEMIGVLMIHSGWGNLESVQDTIYNLTKKGLIHRSVLATIIERQSLFGGYLFKLDSLSNQIIGNTDPEVELCNQNYNSTIFVGYGRKLDEKRQVYLLPPNSPSLSLSDINSFRKHLFYSDLELLYSNPKYLRVSREEYCGFNELMKY